MSIPTFSKNGDTELLAVAQRAGAVAIYQRRGHNERFDPEPLCDITGPQAKLAYWDAVAFVPPYNDCLAACSLQLGAILFFRRTSTSPFAFAGAPDFELRHVQPDGLAFSQCGRCNHGGGSVTVFQRRTKIFSGSKLVYGPEPVTIIRDPQFRYPHSVAFTPKTNHLVVTNAGANYFGVYAPVSFYFGLKWTQSPIAQVIAHNDAEFQVVNMANKMEGGPKGVAIHREKLAVCSPQIRVRIYHIKESGWLAAQKRFA